MRKWWREKYRIPTTDPRYLSITDEEIEIEYYEDKILEEERKKREEKISCDSCGFEGDLLPGNVCPKCGSIVEQVYEDTDYEQYLRELNINLKDIKKK